LAARRAADRGLDALPNPKPYTSPTRSGSRQDVNEAGGVKALGPFFRTSHLE
jgi:hypothetical protein